MRLRALALVAAVALVAFGLLRSGEEAPTASEVGSAPSAVPGEPEPVALGPATASAGSAPVDKRCPAMRALDAPFPAPESSVCPTASPLAPVDGAQFRFRRTANVLTLRARYADSNGGADNELEFRVFGSDGRLVASEILERVRAGEVSWTLPPGLLRQGERYSWTVRGYDPTGRRYSRVAPPSRFQGVVVGASMHPLWADLDDFERGLDLLRDAGATAVRIDLVWGELEQQGAGSFSDRIGGDPGNAYAANADRFFAAARSRGLGVIVDLWGTPCWAATTPERNCADPDWPDTQPAILRSTPTDFGAYAASAAKVARRWGDSIEALEIWNEPNSESFLTAGDCRAVDDCPPADVYSRLLKAAYPAVKRASPGTRVLGGAIAGGDARFLEWLYAPSRSIRGFHDGISAHPYDFEQPRLPAVADFLEVMEDHGEAERGLWLTEVGLSTCTDPADGSRCNRTQAHQAGYLARALDREAGPRGDGQVRALMVYNLRDKTPGPDFESNFGIVKRSFEPKPAYDAVRAVLSGIPAR